MRWRYFFSRTRSGISQTPNPGSAGTLAGCRLWDARSPEAVPKSDRDRPLHKTSQADDVRVGVMTSTRDGSPS
jgi:hypothetical protein